MKITKARFMVYGCKPPSNSRMKKEISLDSISGYFEYTGREEAKDVEKEVEDNESGYFGYTGSHSVGTSSSMGMLNTREDRKKFKKEIKKYFYKKGNVCWDLVISLESDEEAAKLGLETVDNWNSVMSDALPKIFKQYDLEYNNVLWWFDVHRNTEHPHVHLAFIEKHQTRFKGKISKAKLENVKRSIYTCIVARQKLAEKTGYDYKEYFKLKDWEFNQFMTLVKGKDLSKLKTLNQLLDALPKTGRLQYNSYNMKEYKPAIDRIIDEIIFNSPDLKKQYDLLIERIDVLEEIMNEESVGISTLKEAELNKLHERIGNYILKNYKKTEKIKIKKETKVIRKVKYLNEKRLEGFIYSVALEQQNSINKSIEEYYERMQNNLIV